MRYERRPSSTRCHRSSTAYRLPHKRGPARKRTNRGMGVVRDTQHSEILEVVEDRLETSMDRRNRWIVTG